MTDQIKIEKRLIEKSPGSFIFEFDNEIPPEKCDEIVHRFEESKDDHYRGRVGPNFKILDMRYKELMSVNIFIGILILVVTK